MKKNKLFDIIDRTRLFTMLYSGVEDFTSFKIVYDMGIRNFLISYHYAKSPSVMKRYEDLGVKFFIDSGAYTYMVNEEYHDKDEAFWEQQIVEYLDWARKYKDYIFAIASLDLEQLENISAETVQRWNEEYFEKFMLETGIPVCFVWHDGSTKLSWEQYCQRYPYVGLSWSTSCFSDIDVAINENKKKLKVAEKYGSVVHGMAMTRTAILPKLPFYTVDSTSWLVGLQYGEVNYWNPQKKKMSRLTKEKWKGEYFEKLCREFNLNRQGMLDETREELVKVNMYAYIQAEEYIRDRLKPLAYWLKAVKSVNSVEDFDFPSEETLENLEFLDEVEFKEIASSMNINPEHDKGEVISFIGDLSVYLNWNEDMYETFKEDYTEDYIKSCHDYYINAVADSIEERLEDLYKYFQNILSGKDTTLLYIGTDFDRQTKERDSYVEEEEFETQEISAEEYNDLVSQTTLALTHGESNAPEIDELDKEIFSNTGFNAIRDERGRLVKGQRAVRKYKKLYSDKYPKLACNTCYAAQTCPSYQEGYVCAYNKMFKRFDCRNAEDVLDAMQGMVNLNMERMQRAVIFETLEGGIADATVTNFIDQNMRLLSHMQQVQEAQQAVVRQTRIINADGSMQETTQVNSNTGSGVMEALMKNLMSSRETQEDIDVNEVITVNPEDVIVKD